MARKPPAGAAGRGIARSAKSPPRWHGALVLTFRTRQLSGFGKELSLNAKMLEVGVSAIVQKI